MTRAAYVSFDEPNPNTGSGQVIIHETNALRQVCDDLTVITRKDIKGADQYEFNPFFYDYFASLLVPKDLDFLDMHCSPGVAILEAAKPKKYVVSIIAHDLDISISEHEKYFGKGTYPYKHNTDPYLHEILLKHAEGADSIVTPSTGSERWIRANIKNPRVTVIPHGTEIPETVQPLPASLKFGYLGAFGPDKGLLYLLMAWLHFTIRLLGSGELVFGGGHCQYIKQLATQIDPTLRNQIYLGWVDKVSDFYNQVSVYIQPSVSEGFGIECLTPGTSIQTYAGVKTIEDIKIGELVLTHTGSFKPVSKTIARSYNGDIVKIRTFKYYEPVYATPEHPILIIKRPPKKWKKGRLWEEQTPEWVQAKDIKKGDCLLSPIPKQCIFGQNVEIAPALGELLGWYIAEGCPGDGVVWSLNAKEQDVSSRISEIMQALFNLKTTEKIEGNKMWVRGYSAILGVLFPSLAGDGAHNKRIPRAILYGDIKTLEKTIDSIYRGDGWTSEAKPPNMKKLDTVSRQLAFDLYFGLLRLGEKPLLLFGAGSERNAYRVEWSRSEKRVVGNRSWLLNGYMACLVKEVATENYTGIVHNLEVDEDNSYVAGVFSFHNCIEAMAHGRPAIATTGTCGPDVITDGVDGFVVPARDPKALLDKLNFFRDNPGKIAEMGAKAREKAKLFSWEAVEQKYIEFYKGILGGA